MKKLTALLLTVLLLTNLSVFPAYCEQVVTEDGAVYNSDMTVLVRYPAGNTQDSFVLPETVVKIQAHAFENNSRLKYVTLNKKLVEIGERAFLGCSQLREIVIPNSVMAIRSQAFFECERLKSIKIGNGVKTLVYDAFNSCGAIKTVYIGTGLKKLNCFNSILESESLQSFEVSKKNKYFSSADGVLYDKKKTMLIRYPASKTGGSFTIPKSVKTVYDSAFSMNRKIKKLTVNKTVTSIKPFAFFAMEALESVKLSFKAKTVSGNCFAYCDRLKEVKIPSGVTTVGDYAFFKCKSLKKIVIPKSVKTIGLCVDEECQKLKSVTVPKSVKKIGSYAFGFGKYDEEKGVYRRRSGFVLKGYKNSAAQTYAKEFKIKFKKIG